jgi:hypothetical protein
MNTLCAKFISTTTSLWLVDCLPRHCWLHSCHLLWEMRSANLLESKDVASNRQVSNPADPVATACYVIDGDMIMLCYFGLFRRRLSYGWKLTWVNRHGTSVMYTTDLRKKANSEQEALINWFRLMKNSTCLTVSSYFVLSPRRGK